MQLVQALAYHMLWGLGTKELAVTYGKNLTDNFWTIPYVFTGTL